MAASQQCDGGKCHSAQAAQDRADRLAERSIALIFAIDSLLPLTDRERVECEDAGDALSRPVPESARDANDARRQFQMPSLCRPPSVGERAAGLPCPRKSMTRIESGVEERAAEFCLEHGALVGADLRAIRSNARDGLTSKGGEPGRVQGERDVVGAAANNSERVAWPCLAGPLMVVRDAAAGLRSD